MKGPEMSNQETTIYKVYKTLKGAELFIARYLTNTPNAHIEVIDNKFFVVA
jgi:hypothetical protein